MANGDEGTGFYLPPDAPTSEQPPMLGGGQPPQPLASPQRNPRESMLEALMQMRSQQEPDTEQPKAQAGMLKRVLGGYFKNIAYTLAGIEPEEHKQERLARLDLAGRMVGVAEENAASLRAQREALADDRADRADERTEKLRLAKPAIISPQLRKFLYGDAIPADLELSMTQGGLEDLQKEKLKGLIAAQKPDTSISDAEMYVGAAKGDPMMQKALALRNQERTNRIQLQINAVDSRMDKRYGLQLNMASRKLQAQFGPAESALDEISTQYDKVVGSSDPSARLREWRVLNGLVKSKASLIARANGEKGNLAEGDVIRSLEGLSDAAWVAAGDPMGIQKAKILSTKNSLLTSKQRALDAFAQQANATDTGEFGERDSAPVVQWEKGPDGKPRRVQ